MSDPFDHRPEPLRGFGTDLSPTFRTLAHRDSKQIESFLIEEASIDFEYSPIPANVYTSYDYHRLEVERIWKKCWQVACREEEIPAVGDHFIYDIAGLSYIVVRTSEDCIKAFHNVCLHRGRQLVDKSSCGATQFKCAYHAWTWNIDGSLAWYPGKWDFPDIQLGSHDLHEIRVECWNGFVFVNPDQQAGPLAKHIGSMAKHFDAWPLDQRVAIWHVRKTIRANWKVALEAFLEAYHVVMTHPQALPSVAEHGSQYDVWEEDETGYSRLVTPAAVPSAHIKDVTAIDAIRDMWSLLNGLRMDDTPPLPDGITDRATLAAWRREALCELTRADYSQLSDAMMLDSIQYWLFPNFCPWLGEGLPLSYVFRPNEDGPDTCYMDAWMLVRVPDEGPRPKAGSVIELGPDDPFEPHIGAMGKIFDQDDFNMPKVQNGLKAWPADLPGLTLGRYQEQRIRLLHRMVNKWIGH